MTDAEWLACDDPQRMLVALGATVSARKLRLFGCACCRLIWPLIPHELNRRAISCVEEFPEDVAGEQYPRGVWSHPQLDRALVGSSSVEHQFGGFPAYWAVKYLGRSYYKLTPASAIGAVLWRARQAVGEAAAEGAAQAALLRDIVTPSRIATAGPLPSTPASLALAAYEERKEPSGQLDNGRLGVLSDALEEAGGIDPRILAHLRSPGPHVRGCWALDLVLGKG